MNYLRLYEMDVVLDFLLIVLQLKLLAGLEPLLDELVLSLAPESYELMQVPSLITNYKISAEQHISFMNCQNYEAYYVPNLLDPLHGPDGVLP